MDTIQPASADLDADRERLLTTATADPRVAVGLAYFNAAITRVPSPTITNFAPVHYSTSSTPR
ncbi:hypothetical protein [Nocardioides sp. PD653]|uniref:hypothetical protein n=1 Tax=Nocardioides sp. PD653 TaxID=393303 RepID=UPI001054B215|nr:hypothetical protein [Nocardioides sp. PD653]